MDMLEPPKINLNHQLKTSNHRYQPLTTTNHPKPSQKPIQKFPIQSHDHPLLSNDRQVNTIPQTICHER
jgi:hypothetical protein